MAKNRVIDDIDQNEIDTLEAFNYEMSSRRDLIASMVQMGIPMSDPNFKQYHQEYQDWYVKYESAKSEFERKYVKPIAGDRSLNWNLDFHDKTLTIYGID